MRRASTHASARECMCACACARARPCSQSSKGLQARRTCIVPARAFAHPGIASPELYDTGAVPARLQDQC
eukprot:14054530-Alexandrium_andersonii.AAC.1